MITPSPNVSYTQCSANIEKIFNKIYKSKTPLELLTFKNQTAYGYKAIPKLVIMIMMLTKINSIHPPITDKILITIL